MKFITQKQRTAAAHKANAKSARRPVRNSRLINDYEILWEPASKWAYVWLVCGHPTTPESIEATALWRPKKSRKLYCEICGKWIRKQPKPPKFEYPEEPLFLWLKKKQELN